MSRIVVEAVIRSLRGTTFTLDEAREIAECLILCIDPRDRDVFPKVAFASRQLPAHLQDDAPYIVCNKCERKSWSLDDLHEKCEMAQPSGYKCNGTFVEVIRATST
jgi:hypothetical protein